MKTITLKADSGFDETLTGLAEELDMTKSAVIRAAVLNYKRQIERESLARSLRSASLKVRRQAESANSDFAVDLADGL
jgi:predicted transcriptional regulator